jgi:hypothetical protein
MRDCLPSFDGPEILAGKYRSCQDGRAQIGLAQIGLEQVGSVQAGPSQIGPDQVSPALQPHFLTSAIWRYCGASNYLERQSPHGSQPLAPHCASKSWVVSEKNLG